MFFVRSQGMKRRGPVEGVVRSAWGAQELRGSWTLDRFIRCISGFWFLSLDVSWFMETLSKSPPLQQRRIWGSSASPIRYGRKMKQNSQGSFTGIWWDMAWYGICFGWRLQAHFPVSTWYITFVQLYSCTSHNYSSGSCWDIMWLCYIDIIRT